MAIRTRKMISLVLTTGSGRTLTLDRTPGDENLSSMRAGAYETSRVLSRGTFIERVAGDDAPVAFSVTLYHSDVLGHATLSKVKDFLEKLGSCASDTTVDPGGVVWALKVTMTITHPTGGTDTATVGNCRFTWNYQAAAESNTLALTGEAERDGSGNAPVVWS
jgi:hypothetical protein